MNTLAYKSSSTVKPGLPVGGAKHFVQPKLEINQPGDKYEQEADAMAERVMRMPSKETPITSITGLIGASVQRKCAACEEEEKKKRPIMRKAEAGHAGIQAAPSLVSSLNASKGGGSSLPSGTKSFMENAFSTDFSGVRVHTGSDATEMSRGINAKAFTYGSDIYFNSRQYDPENIEGRKLLAHELTHVLQQEKTKVSGVQRFCISDVAECANQCGMPGDFVSQSEASVETARTGVAQQIAADHGAVARTGQSRRAINLETFAINNGLYPRPHLYGIFVDNTMPSSYGAVTTTCNSFTLWTSPYTGPADSYCTFFTDAREHEAETYNNNPGATIIDEMTREEWFSLVLSLITHEFQHVAFDTVTHPALTGATCARNTTVSTAVNGAPYDVNYFLSELGAEISEFLSLYNQLDRRFPPLWHPHETGPVALQQMDQRRYNDMMHEAVADYSETVDNCGEGIRGIIRALRCHCTCTEADFYIHDTEVFTTSRWQPHILSFFRDMMQHQIPGLRWP